MGVVLPAPAISQALGLGDRLLHGQVVVAARSSRASSTGARKVCRVSVANAAKVGFGVHKEIMQGVEFALRVMIVSMGARSECQ
jgi:hypothetical protein